MAARMTPSRVPPKDTLSAISATCPATATCRFGPAGRLGRVDELLGQFRREVLGQPVEGDGGERRSCRRR